MEQKGAYIYELHAILLKLFIFILLLLLSACKLTEKNVYGNYSKEKAFKTFYQFDTAGKFTFFKCDPYLALLKHQNYITTNGNWTIRDGRTIVLNSVDSSDYKNAVVKKIKSGNISTFTFIDISGDTIPIIGATKNGQWFGRIHNLMKTFDLNLSPGDTITADFSGYDTFRFTNIDAEQFKHDVFLYPNYSRDYFRDKVLLIKKSKIVDANLDETYKKKNGM
jgi:hypothetical protein